MNTCDESVRPAERLLSALRLACVIGENRLACDEDQQHQQEVPMQSVPFSNCSRQAFPKPTTPHLLQTLVAACRHPSHKLMQN